MSPARRAAVLESYRADFQQAVDAARAAGVVVTVEQVPLRPLTMGHYATVVHVRDERSFAHDLYTEDDEDPPQAILDRNGSVVLSLCKRCGLGEAELDYPCLPRRGVV